LKERVGLFWGKEESKRWKEKDCNEERLREAIDERWQWCSEKEEAISQRLSECCIKVDTIWA